MNEGTIISELNCSDLIGLDIGANHGLYTDSIAKKCRVCYAFEPHPGNFTILQEKIKEPNIILINKAVGQTEGQVKLYENDNPGGHSLSDKLAEATKWGHSFDRFMMVDVITLDEMFKGHTDIGFMKIDVEAYEESVLRGASVLLDTNNIKIALECHQTINCEAIYRFLATKGYQIQEGKDIVHKLETDHRYFIHR